MGEAEVTIGASDDSRVPRANRSQTRAAQQAIRAMVDYIEAAGKVSHPGFVQISDAAAHVVARAGAVAAAKAFVASCSTEE